MTKTTRWSQQVDALLCKDFFERISRDWTILMSKVEHHHTLCCSREKRFRKGMFSNVFTCGMWLPCVRRISDEGGFELKLLWLQITNSWGIPTRNDTQLCIVIFKCMQKEQFEVLNPAWNSFACLWAPTAYPWPSYGWKMIEGRCTKVIWVVGFRQ